MPGDRTEIAPRSHYDRATTAGATGPGGGGHGGARTRFPVRAAREWASGGGSVAVRARDSPHPPRPGEPGSPARGRARGGGVGDGGGARAVAPTAAAKGREAAGGRRLAGRRPGGRRGGGILSASVAVTGSSVTASVPRSIVSWERRGRGATAGPEFPTRLTAVARDISRFFPRIDRIFPREALNPFFGAQDEGFLEFRSR